MGAAAMNHYARIAKARAAAPIGRGADFLDG
jgi:hypothetical protein